MRASPVSGRQRFICFRLTDIPLDLRLRAARSLAQRGSRALPDDETSGAQRILARLRSDFWDVETETDTSTYEGLRKVAEHPSARVYRIRVEAYEKIMGTPS